MELYTAPAIRAARIARPRTGHPRASRAPSDVLRTPRLKPAGEAAGHRRRLRSARVGANPTDPAESRALPLAAPGSARARPHFLTPLPAPLSTPISLSPPALFSSNEASDHQSPTRRSGSRPGRGRVPSRGPCSTPHRRETPIDSPPKTQPRDAHDRLCPLEGTLPRPEAGTRSAADAEATLRRPPKPLFDEPRSHSSTSPEAALQRAPKPHFDGSEAPRRRTPKPYFGSAKAATPRRALTRR